MCDGWNCSIREIYSGTFRMTDESGSVALS
jgi:hypothetical protein